MTESVRIIFFFQGQGRGWSMFLSYLYDFNLEHANVLNVFIKTQKDFTRQMRRSRSLSFEGEEVWLFIFEKKRK